MTAAPGVWTCHGVTCSAHVAFAEGERVLLADGSTGTVEAQHYFSRPGCSEPNCCTEDDPAQPYYEVRLDDGHWVERTPDQLRRLSPAVRDAQPPAHL